MSELNDQRIDSIMKLAMSEALQGGKFKDFISELLPAVCNCLSASQVSFWLFRKEKDEFESIHSFDAETKKSSTGEAFEKGSFTEFTKTLKAQQFTYADNGDDSSQMEEFVVDYLLRNRLRSWTGMQVWNDNRLFGIVTAEWKGKKDFGNQDRMILLTASTMISQCYDALLRLKEDFLHRNEMSSLKGEEKEKEKLAKKLADHAFYTSHSIRHPLATILALIDLIKLNWESRETYEELLQQLKIETMNLDDAIRVMTAKIELD